MSQNKITLQETNEGKTVAIVSYLTLIGLIIALVMNKNNPTSLGKFHIRQSIGISVTALVLSLLNIVPGIGGLLSQVASIVILIALILGVIAAVKSEEKGIPVLGPLYQKWFSMI